MKKDYWNYDDPAYEEAEINANKFNFTFTAALIIVDVFILLLTVFGVFTVAFETIIISFIISFSLFLTPLVVLLFHNVILKKERTLLKWKQCKYLIYVPVYFALLTVDILLSHHAVLLIVIPPLMAAQYRFIRRDWFLIFITTMATIPIVIYGSYIFGVADLNILKGIDTSELDTIEARLNSLTWDRTWELFLHYCLPRMIAIVTIDFLMATLVQRNVIMLGEPTRQLNNRASGLYIG